MIEIKFDKINEERYDAMVQWCTEQYGRPALWPQQMTIPDSPTLWRVTNAWDRVNGVREEFGRACFTFRNQEDATVFSLKWS